MRKTPLILITRPAHAADRLAAAFINAGAAAADIAVAPLLAVEGTNVAVDWQNDQVIATSEHALRFAGTPPAGRIAWCVGARTAKVAERMGYEVIEGPGDAVGLLAQIRQARVPGPFLYLRGDVVAHDLERDLAKSGATVRSVITYRQRPLPLPQATQTALMSDRPIIAPVFSPRSAELLTPFWPAGRHAIVAFSQNIADKAPRAAMCTILDHPSAESMISHVMRLYSDPGLLEGAGPAV